MKKNIFAPSQIEQVAVSNLTPYARNSRTHSPQQVKQIAASIKEFGFINPIIVDKSGTIIAGHGRLLAAEHLQMDTVPCVRIEHMTETQRRAYVIADNKLALNAGWDEELLKIELDDLHFADFDVSLVGFEAEELIETMGLLNVGETEMPDLPDGEKDPFRQMTFKIHEKQEKDVIQALELAAGMVTFEEKLKFTQWMRSTGVSRKQIDEATNSNMGSHYFTDKTQPEVPTLDMWSTFAHLMPDPPAEIIELIKRRTKQEELNANRNGNALHKICLVYLANANS